MGEAISNSPSELLWLSREQARRIDRLAIERGISGDALMERAGTRCSELILREYTPRTVWIACGSGNNGGDGLVIARKLMQAGVAVRVWLFGKRERMSPDTAANLERWIAIGGGVEAWPPRLMPQPAPNLVVDCLLGTGSSGNPRGEIAEAINWLNQLNGPRIAIDLPSGLDCDSGQPGRPTVRADRTLTMVGPKLGFQELAAEEWIGKWQVVNLEVPFEIIRKALQAAS